MAWYRRDARDAVFGYERKGAARGVLEESKEQLLNEHKEALRMALGVMKIKTLRESGRFAQAEKVTNGIPVIEILYAATSMVANYASLTARMLTGEESTGEGVAAEFQELAEELGIKADARKLEATARQAMAELVFVADTLIRMIESLEEDAARGKAGGEGGEDAASSGTGVH